MNQNNSRFLIADGAMGTMLQKYGLPRGERSDIMNITNPDTVETIHRMYLEAGSDIIYTNTFGANAKALENTGYTPENIIEAAVSIAKRACNSVNSIVLDIGPLGTLLEPMGVMEHSEAYDIFAQQAVLGEKAGVDFVGLETMSDISELMTAMFAVTENTNLQIIASMTFQDNAMTYIGYTPEDLATISEGESEYFAIGLNCSLAPYDMIETAKRFAISSTHPLIIKPNAGLPEGPNSEYSISPSEFASQMVQLVEAIDEIDEASGLLEKMGQKRLLIIGGCCGTTPQYINDLRRLLV
ncbi:MAG: homocysteine S-methyltransferase family protein [Oscillospiraceae bacterium]|nr:homocysteine S-methyltransferase family protein [Oscillospiraceae bacterium]